MNSNAIGQGINLLIVAGKSDLVYLLSEVFTNLGFVVHQVPCGNQALSFLYNMGNPKIDAILSDVVMDDGNGFELATQLVADNFRIPVFLMCDKKSEHDLGATFPGVMDAFLKPVRPKDIAPKIVSSVERCRKGKGILSNLFSI